jgi:hypothetical protein
MSVRVEGKLFTGNVSAAFFRAANQTKDRALKVTRDRTRVKTGKLRSGWVSQITGGSSSISLAIMNGVEYAVFQENGTKYIPPMMAAAAGLETATSLFQQELQRELTVEIGGSIQSLASSSRTPKVSR